MRGFIGDRRGSAPQWFALAAAVLCVASVAGAHALEWLSQSGRVAVVAYRPTAAAPAVQLGGDPGIDLTPTGSIPSTSVVIRLR